MGLEHLGVGGAPLRLKEHGMSKLEKLRAHFDNWQAQGYETRPVWMDRHIEACINQLSNVELLELLDMFDEIEEREKTK